MLSQKFANRLASLCVVLGRLGFWSGEAWELAVLTYQCLVGQVQRCRSDDEYSWSEVVECCVRGAMLCVWEARLSSAGVKMLTGFMEGFEYLTQFPNPFERHGSALLWLLVSVQLKHRNGFGVMRSWDMHTWTRRIGVWVFIVWPVSTSFQKLSCG